MVGLVLKRANEYELWGDTKIQEGGNYPGNEISRDIVANILREHGIEPAHARGSRTIWAD